MSQLSIDFLEKLDAPLAELCNGQGLADYARVPVLIRCDRASMDSISSRVVALGGKVRHQLSRFSTIAAWVPIEALQDLAAEVSVVSIELEQEFEIA